MRSTHTTLRAALLGAALLAAGALTAAPGPAPGPAKAKLTADEWAKAEKAVKARLEELKARFHQVTPVKDASLEKALPDYAFFAVLFRQYPIPVGTPAGLKASNVFAWGRDGKLQVFTDSAQLEKFFKEKLAAATTDDQLKDDARAWLALAQQFRQDGFYKFVLMDKATAVRKTATGKSVSAEVVVMAGGNGQLDARLDFNAAGKLTAVRETSKLRPGPRPICQATKLLDADPLVRRMAEQDLLIMGRYARPYLDEQRAKASPELRRAIDRLWQRIVEQDR
jgi:hypothetical protein